MDSIPARLATAAPVSICLPIYNGKDYLTECIESILQQTYRDFELLIVDDGSNDASPEIVRAYAARDERIRYHRNEHNLGLVANWNRCVELARHAWIKFVFQDDVIAPTCLERLMNLATDPAKLVTCRRDFIFDDTVDARRRGWYTDNQQLIDRCFASGDLDAEACRRLALDHMGINLYGEPTSVLLHRSFFERFGLFREALIMWCDFEYWTRVATHTGARYVPETLATFRVHAGATSAQNHALRAFRTNTLDNLVLLRDFAVEPMYAPLRDYAARMDPPIDLGALLREQTHAAYATADWARRSPTNPDSSLMKDLQQLSRKVSHLSVPPLEHILWRLRLRLRSRASRSEAGAR